MRNKALASVLLGAGLWLAWSDCGKAFFPWRHRARHASESFAQEPPFGGVVPEYGKDPRIVPNPYPWRVPSMYSGFRHYHMPPLMGPDGCGAQLAVPDAGPAEEAPIPQEAPTPRKKL
jgi:hypothetical protein